MTLDEIKKRTDKLQQEANEEYQKRFLVTLSKHKIRFWLIRLLSKLFGYLTLKEKDVPTRGRYIDYFIKEVKKYCRTK